MDLCVDLYQSSTEQDLVWIHFFDDSETDTDRSTIKLTLRSMDIDNVIAVAIEPYQ